MNTTKDTLFKVLSKIFVLIVLLALPTKALCMSQSSIDFEKLANAIRLAEGNSNYGVISHYKHTSYRQACINTCKHAWKDYSKEGIKGRPGASNSKLAYLWFLSKRYCPVGASNDPTGLNKNWLKNVTYYYKGGI